MSKYDKSFKEEAIRLALSSPQPIAKTARDLGIKESLLYSWVSEEKTKNQKPKTKPSSMKAAIKPILLKS